MDDPQVIKQIIDCRGGIQNRRGSRFGMNPNALLDVRNFIVSDGGLVTRPGYVPIGTVPGPVDNPGYVLDLLDDLTLGSVTHIGNIHGRQITGASSNTLYYASMNNDAMAWALSGTTYNGHVSISTREINPNNSPDTGFLLSQSSEDWSLGNNGIETGIISAYIKPPSPMGTTTVVIVEHSYAYANIINGVWGDLVVAYPRWYFDVEFGASANNVHVRGRIYEDADTDLLIEDAGTDFTDATLEWIRVDIEVTGREVTLKADLAASWAGTVRATDTLSFDFPSCVNAFTGAYQRNSGGPFSVILSVLNTPPTYEEGEVKRLWQVRFPTNESKYLIAQSEEGHTLQVSSTALPSASLAFEELYDLEANAGQVNIAPLNDKAVITEGINKPPLAFQGSLADNGSDWATPLGCMISPDGITYHDVGNEVSDKDPDTVADVGNISPLGGLLIRSELPQLSAINVTVHTPNTGVGAAATAKTLTLDADSDIVREDTKGNIVYWVSDSGTTGHFEEASKTLSGAAVDLGGGLVKVPCVGHGFIEGDFIEIRETTNYDGTEELPSQASGNTDNFVITATYVAETFASPDNARKRWPSVSQIEISRPSSGGGVVGTWDNFSGGSYSYTEVDEEVLDTVDGNRCISTSGRCTYGVGPFTVPAGATVDNVRVTRVERATAAGFIGKSRIAVGGTGYDSADSQALDDTQWYTNTSIWTTNPKTAVDWTVDDVNGVGGNALETAGTSFTGGDGVHYYKVAQLYTQVYYHVASDLGLVEEGQQVILDDSTELIIMEIGANPWEDGGITLSATHANATVSHIYGLEVDATFGITMVTPSTDVPVEVIAPALDGGLTQQGTYRIVIPTNAGLSASNSIYLVIKAGNSLGSGILSMSVKASIGVRDTGANTVSQPILFQWLTAVGLSYQGFLQSAGGEITSQPLGFDYDPVNNEHIISLCVGPY